MFSSQPQQDSPSPAELLTQISTGQRSAGSAARSLAPALDAANDVDKWKPMRFPSGPEDRDRGVRPSSASPFHSSLSRKTWEFKKRSPDRRAGSHRGFIPPSLPAFLAAVYFAVIILLACQQEHHPHGESKASLFDPFDEARLWSSSV